MRGAAVFGRQAARDRVGCPSHRPCAAPHPARVGPCAAGANPIRDLIQLIYSSRPFGYDAAILSGILLHARQANPRDGITGALICRRDIYLQLLEGPAAAVRGTYARIRRDDRHLDVRLHVSEPVTGRLFADWAMLHDPARSMIWPEAELTDARLAQLTPAEARQVFAALAADVRRCS